MEKKNKGLIITIIVLVVCLLGTCGYIAYDKLIKKEEPKQEEKKPEEKKEENQNNIENQEPKEDENQLGLKLFEMVNKRTAYNSSNGDFALITGNKKYNSLSKSEILDVVSDNVSQDLKVKNPEFEKISEGMLLDNPDLPYEYSIKKSDFENAFHRLFGINSIFDYNNVDVENGTIHFSWKNMDENVECYQLVSYDHSNYINNNELAVYINVDRSNNDLCDWIELNTFKVTFKKDSNNNWYWYSSEKAN